VGFIVFFKWAFSKSPGGFFWVVFFLQQPWLQYKSVEKIGSV